MKIIKQFIKDKEFWLLSLFKELIAICVLFPLLYNFCNAWNITYQWTVDLWAWNFYTQNSILYFSIPYNKTFTFNETQTLTYECEFYNVNNYQDLNQNYHLTLRNSYVDPNRDWNSFRSNTLNDFYFNPYDNSFDWNNKFTINWTISWGLTVWLNLATNDRYDYLSFNYKCVITWDNVQWATQCPTCPDQYSSLQCQSEYNLIPISSVDQSYCENNNLCSVWGGDCESWSVNWSSLYINNIQHLGKPNIFITIPEEIDWDYTNETWSFDLEIVWYNVDYEKMNEILSVQHYKPTSEDFTQAVWILAPYMKIFLFILFVFIVIKRLKKPFKSRLK